MRHAVSSLPRFFGRLALALGLAAAMGVANASVIWTLNNFTFADGAKATGSFAWDPATNTVTAWNIVTTTGAIAGHTYANTLANNNYSTFAPNNWIVFGGPSRWHFRIGLENLDQLDTPAAHLGLHSMAPNTTGPDGFIECQNCGSSRLGLAGAYLSAQGAAAVPEPATPALMAAALAMLAVARRRA